MSVIFTGMSPELYDHYPAHEHSVWEIILNLQGEGYVLIGDRKYEYHPGTILCYPPGIPHTKYSKNGFRDVFLMPSSFPLSRLSEDNKALVFQDDAEKSLETLMLLAHRTFHKKGKNCRHLVDSIFETICQLLISWLQGEVEENDIERLKNKLTDSFADPGLSITKFLKESPYCDDHIRRRFKQVTGCTPQEYLTQLRLEYAKKLMSENNLLHYSISNIGAMSGYYDSHYFSRIFKKNTGMTPSEFQEQVAPIAKHALFAAACQAPK